MSTPTATTSEGFKEVYTTRELAELLHVRRQTVSEYRKAGLLDAVKIGKGYLFNVETVREFFRTWSGYDLSSRETIKAAGSMRKQKNHSVTTPWKK